MKQMSLWGLLPVAVMFVVFGVFYALFSNKLLDEGMLYSSVALLGLAAGSASYMIAKGLSQGWNGSNGVAAVLSGLLLLVTGAGVALAINDMPLESMVTGLVTVVGFAILLVTVSSNETMSIGTLWVRSGAKGSPTAWADRIEAIGRRCTRPELKTKVLRLGGETRFLSVDAGPGNPEINQGIGRAIDELSEVVRRGDELSSMSQLSRIRSMFAERENSMKNFRSPL
ncbi:MAG: hypothetical protein HGB00_07550 [Chlorobiaceae bacterium]|nr:hypothetical protein [Chlorobiaceae bacterium]